ncbi:hypothetical protein WJ968_00780 [Achromobacter xylosoxidans]
MFQDSIPLQRHCLLDSANMAEIRDQVSHHLWSHQMRVPQGNPLQSRLYGVYFGSAALFDLRYGAEVEIDAGDIASYYLVRATLAGSGMVELGRRSAAIRAGSLTVSSPSERSLIRVGSDCRSLILRVERPALERRLQQLLERPLRAPRWCSTWTWPKVRRAWRRCARRWTICAGCTRTPTSTGWRRRWRRASRTT